MTLYAREYPELEPLEARFTSNYNGFDIGPGWISIITELDAKVGSLAPNYTLLQVKEKFGGLRYYIGSTEEEVSDRVYHLINQAIKKADETCAECGKEGKLRRTKHSYYFVSCDNHKGDSKLL